MKSLVVYGSQTGFTKKYAEWIAEGTGADLVPVKEALKKTSDYFGQYDSFAFGSWVMAGNIRHRDSFLKLATLCGSKKIAVFCVGANPKENPDVAALLEKVIPAELKKHAAAFYCHGGLCYEKMPLPMKLMMKSFSSMLKNKRNATEKERLMGEYLKDSFDASDRKYAQPVIEFLHG